MSNQMVKKMVQGIMGSEDFYHKYYSNPRPLSEMVSKVTGMILELDDSKIKDIIESKKELGLIIDESLEILGHKLQLPSEKESDCDEISLSEISSSEGCKNEDCVICMEPLGKKNVCVTECGHSFCTSCLLRAAQTNTDCPLCRTELAPKSELIREEDLNAAYEAGIETGNEQTEYFMRREIDLLEDEVVLKCEEIDNLKEEVRTLKVELDQEKIKMETSLCRSYRKGYDYGIFEAGKKYSEKKNVEKVKKTRPSSIDEWFKIRMSK